MQRLHAEDGHRVGTASSMEIVQGLFGLALLITFPNPLRGCVRVAVGTLVRAWRA